MVAAMYGLRSDWLSERLKAASRAVAPELTPLHSVVHSPAIGAPEGLGSRHLLW